MSDRQKDDFEQLVVLGKLPRNHIFKEGYDYSTDLKQAHREADKPIGAASKKKSSQSLLSTAEVLQALELKALEITRDKTISATQRLIHLRAYAGQHPNGLKDAELKRILWDARRSLGPGAAPVEQGQKLSRAEAPWLWDGVVIQGTTNLIVALPKVGKSRLVCQLIGALTRGESHFLGQKLYAPCPPVLIVGTDQPEQDWAQCLEMAGLLDEDDRMHPCIHKFFHTGAPLHLDEEGILAIAEICQSNAGMLVIVDSYAKCTASLGIPEADSLYAAPLMDLQEAIAPSNATLIVIHHSNRAAVGGRASLSSRGTTALPAAVSQTISLSWANSGDPNPLAKQDRRVKLLGNDIEAAVISEVGRAVGAVIEQGAIAGTGSSNQPLGLLNLPSKLTETFSAATPTSDELASMLEKLGDADIDISRVHFLMHPSTAADLMKSRVDANSGALVLSDLKIHGLPVHISTNVTEDKVIALDPSFVRIVYFGAPQIVVDLFRGGISGTTHVQVLNAMDLAVTHQSAICVGSA